jgi:hypothetical protein
VDVVYPAPDARVRDTRTSVLIVGIGWMVIGLWAWWRTPCEATRRLATLGLTLCGSIAVGLGPVFGGLWSALAGHLSMALTTLAFILWMDFFFAVPRRRAALDNRVARALVWAGWGGLLAFQVVEVVAHPRFYYTTGTVAAVFGMAYLAAGAGAAFYTLSRRREVEPPGSGVAWILAAVLVAVGLLLVPPGAVRAMPGWVFALVWLLIPWAMAVAARRAATGPALASSARAG